MVDGLIIPRSYNDYFSRTELTQFNNAVRNITDATLNASSVNPIQNKAVAEIVPPQASSSNKLADKEFVNSSVSTNTANYISDNGEPFASVAALEAYSGTVTNNDYAFVTGTDSAGNTYYDRYKATVSGNTVTWAKEYRLNNSSFTAAQWDAIQSGITAAKVAQYDAAVGSNTVVPVGTISAYYGSTDPADGQWLICDGRDTTGTAIELETHYPSLYIFLGGTNVLPDLRELTLVGAGQNGTETIAAHDVYTLGQFKDDSVKAAKFGVIDGQANIASTGNGTLQAAENASFNGTWESNQNTTIMASTGTYGESVRRVLNIHAGTTTHGKQKGVNWIIKAISQTDTQPIPSTDIQTIEQYFDNGLGNFLTQLNTWVDVSSDFSVVDSVAWANTPTSSLKVLYNAYQKRLKVWSWYNSTKSASSTHAFTLQYDGNNTNIVFDPTTTIAMQTLNKSYLGYDTTTNPDSAPNSNGFECSYNIKTSKQIRLGGFNRNNGTAWGSNICLVAEISL